MRDMPKASGTKKVRRMGTLRYISIGSILRDTPVSDGDQVTVTIEWGQDERREPQ